MRKRSSQTKEERPLRQGYTTGTCAAAAAKAAAMVLIKSGVRSQESGVRSQESGEISVEIMLPKGERVSFNPMIKEIGEDYAVASVIKSAGDDPDVTNGAAIVAKVALKSGVKSQGSGRLIIKGGRGVGVVTRPGLQVPVGEPAINPVPRRMIKEAVKEVLGDTSVEVTIEVPEGEALAEKTFNPRLGIVGGISIIGTTGIVEPMSLEALRATVRCEIDVAVAESRVTDNSTLKTQHSQLLYFAPGKIGEDALKRLLSGVRVIQTSNFIGFALGYAREKGIEEVVFGGHPGKLAKILMGYYDTHSRNSPQATDFVASYLGVKGEFNTVEEIINLIRTEGLTEKAEGFSSLARELAEKMAGDFCFSKVEVFLFDMKKNLIGEGKWAG